MPKPEILDPQGKAVLGALPRLGFSGVTDVRQGKRFELEVPARSPTTCSTQVRQMAETLLSNPVIENFAGPGGAGAREGRGRHLPRLARRRRRPARGPRRRPRGGRALARRPRPARRGRGGPAGRLLVRRLPALRRDLPVLPGDDRGRRGRRPGDAGARHLQRLPDPVRVPPAARRADPQRPPQVRLPRPAAADREQPHALDLVVRRGRRGHDRAQERRGRVRRRRRDPRPARGGGAGRRPLPRATTPTARCATSPASPTSAATWSA